MRNQRWSHDEMNQRCKSGSLYRRPYIYPMSPRVYDDVDVAQKIAHGLEEARPVPVPDIPGFGKVASKGLSPSKPLGLHRKPRLHSAMPEPSHAQELPWSLSLQSTGHRVPA